MRTLVGLFLLGVLPLVTASLLRAANDPPAWAYAVTPTPPAGAAAAAEPAHDPNRLHQVPGSARTFTIAQVENANEPADWFPEDHPPMPELIAKGRAGSPVRACSFCHMPNGKGRPSNGPAAGLPVSYFIQQLNDFKNGVRKTGEPRKTNVNQMIAIAKAMTPEEMRTAAEYFGSMTWTPWIRVVETNTVPKTRIAGSIYYTLPGNQTEPIGMRIVEVPENNEQSEPLRNPRSGFIAYAPVGSIKKGGARDDRRQRPHRRVRRLPRRRPARHGPGAPHRGPLAKLSRAPDVRHAVRRPPRRVEQPHATRRRQAH